MSVVTADTDTRATPAQVETIEDLVEDDILVVNGDTRTWEVTDVVDRSIDTADDAREHKRVCRLACEGATLGLELVRYPDHHEAQLHVLETNEWTERDRTVPLASIKVLDRTIPWVVVSSGSQVYHFPEPEAAGFGEAAPACGGGTSPAEYRLTRINTVYPAYDACKNCVRHAKPVRLTPVTCPDCEKFICEGVFQRLAAGAVEGLVIACPRCGFDGVASVAIDGAARTEGSG